MSCEELTPSGEQLPAAEAGEMRGPMRGLPLAALAHRSSPLTHRLLRGLDRRGEDLVVVYPRGPARWTGASLRGRAEQLARALVAAGVRPGDRVSLAAGYHAEYAPLFLATLLAGAAWAPINPNFDDGDFRLLLGIIEPRVLLAPPDVARRFRRLFDSLEDEERAEAAARAEEAAAAGDGAGAGAEPVAGAWTSPLLVPLHEGPEWEEFIRPRTPEPRLPAAPFDPAATPALVCCSSGTSGLPKGVVLSVFNLDATLRSIMHEESSPNLDCSMVITSPGFWVTGIYYTLISMLMPLTLIYEHGCTEMELLNSIHKYKPTILFTSNNFLLGTAKAHESAPTHDLSSLRTIIPTGAAMSRDAQDLVQRVTRCQVQQIYGMTEVGVVLGLAKHNLAHKSGSVGKLCAFIQCKVMDPETGLPARAGEEGELCFKGPTVTKGYLKNPRATADLFDAAGWLRSGDLARVDADGFFFVTGRIKDTIKYRGVHVSPVEIEGLLEKHRAVLESAVVGVLDPVTEDEWPRAYVVLRPGGHATAEELCQVVQEQLAPHKWLRGGVVFVDSLPKSATGKISRAAIRKRYLEHVTIGS